MHRYGKVLPRALRPGDFCFLFAPCGAVKEPFRSRGPELLRAAGYGVAEGRSLDAAPAPFSAGPPALRLADWGAALDAGHPALLPARGGYGGVHLLAAAPWARTAAAAPLWIGASDTTYLQTALLQRAGLVTFYGPMPCGQLATGDDHALAAFRATLAGEVPDRYRFAGARRVVGGRASGELRGGCLSILAALCGTPHQPDGRDAILLLEDVGEHPYRIERMLQQLAQAGVLAGARGLVFGTFPDCTDRSGDPELVHRVVDRFARDLGIPTLAGAPIGHGKGAVCVPIGVPASLTEDGLELAASPFR